MGLGVLTTINVDFAENEAYEYITLYSGEIDSRFVEIVPLVRGEEYTIPDGTVARLEARKADNKKILLDCEVDFSKNRIRFAFTEKCLAVEGVIACQIGLYGDDNRFLASSYFYADVIRGVLSGNGSVFGCGCDNVESSDEYQSFRVALLSLDEVQKRANAAIEQINANAENADRATESANAAAERVGLIADAMAEELAKATDTNNRIAAEEAKRIENETVRVDNENARVSNEDQRKKDEEERISSESVREGNETNRIAAERTRSDSEAGRVSAEKSRVAAEASRSQSEKARATAENLRMDAERGRASAESQRSSSELSRLTNEDLRINAEKARKAAEEERADAESARKTAESDRVRSEDERESSEILRVSSEEERDIAEALRVASESVRSEAENGRISAESDRVAAEATRVAAEAERSVAYEGFDTRISENTARSSANHKRLTNLERRLSEEAFVTDATVAYQRYVPTDAMPYAMLAEIGGMTRQCTNLLHPPYYQGSTESYGLAFTANDDGTVTVNGTATATTKYIFMHSQTNPIRLVGGRRYVFRLGAESEMRPYIYYKKADGTDQWAQSIVWDDSYDLKQVYMQCNAGSVFDNVTLYPMLNEGEEALPYEPYFPGLRDAKVTAVKSEGANLIPFPYPGASVEKDDGSKIVINKDASLSASGTPTAAISVTIYRGPIPVPLGDMFTISLHGDFSGVSFNAELYDKDGARLYNANNTSKLIIDTANYPLADTLVIGIKRQANGVPMSGTGWPMMNRGDVALPYSPHGTLDTFPIPEAVQALDGYGHGVNETYYNSLVFDLANSVKKFVKVCEKRAYTSGDELLADVVTDGETETVYVMASPVEVDVSGHFTEDNFIEVDGGGTLTAVNEHEYAVPMTVEYMVKEAES